MPTFNVDVNVRTGQANRALVGFDRNLQRVQRTSDRLGRNLNRLLAGFAAFRALRSFSQFSDSFTTLQNRVRQLTNSQAELNAVTERLFDIANNNRQAIDSIAESYTRTARVTQNLGISQEQLLNFTEQVSQAILLSGASAEEARRGLIQLAQGLSIGSLQGRDLRSVMEQLPGVAQVLADDLGVSVGGALRDLGAQGVLTPQRIIGAFERASEDLARRVQETIPTIEQQFTILRNRITEFIGNSEQAASVSRVIAAAIRLIGENLELIARAAVFAATALGATFVRRGLVVATNAVRAFTATLLANPLTALPTIIIAATAAIVAFGDQIGILGTEFATLQDVAVVVLDRIQSLFVMLFDNLGVLFSRIGAFFNFSDVEISVAGTVQTIANILDVLIASFAGAGRALAVAIADLPRIVGTAIINLLPVTEQGLNDFINRQLALFQTFGQTISSLVGGIADSFRALSLATNEALSGDFTGAAGLVGTARQTVSATIDSNFAVFNDRFQANLQNFQSNILPPLDDSLAESLRRTGESAIQAFNEGFTANSSNVTNGLESVLNEAEARARAREEEAARRRAAQADVNLAGLTPGGGPVGVQTGSDRNATEIDKETLAIQNQILALRDLISVTQERAQANELTREFATDGIELTEAQTAAFEAQFAQLNQLQAQADVFENLRAPIQSLRSEYDSLDALYRSGRISQDEYELGLENIRRAGLRLEADQGGIRASLQLTLEQMTNLSDIINNVVVGAINTLTEAIVEFAETGKFEFRELIQSILQSLLQLLIQQALIRLVQALLGDSSSSISSLINAGTNAAQRQGGGPVTQNRPYIVGERGPELFVPNQAGQVLTNRETMGLAGANRMQQAPTINLPQQPPPNVNVVVVSNDQQAREQIEAGELDDAIITRVASNRRKVRNAIGLNR